MPARAVNTSNVSFVGSGSSLAVSLFCQETFLHYVCLHLGVLNRVKAAYFCGVITKISSCRVNTTSRGESNG